MTYLKWSYCKLLVEFGPESTSSNKRKLNIDLHSSWFQNQLFLENTWDVGNEYPLLLCHIYFHLFHALLPCQKQTHKQTDKYKSKELISEKSNCITNSVLNCKYVRKEQCWHLGNIVRGFLETPMSLLEQRFEKDVFQWFSPSTRLNSKQAESERRKENPSLYISAGIFAFSSFCISFFLDFLTHLEQVLPITFSLRM